MTEPRGSRRIFALLCLLVWATRMVLPGDIAYSPLDRSWAAGLGHALAHGWRAGVDCVFTFGPLGALSTAVYVPELFWVKVVVWEGAFQLLAAVVLTAAGLGIEQRLLRWLFFLLILVQPLDVDAHAFLTIAAAFAWLTRTRRIPALAICATVLAGLALVKFTYAIAALVCACAAAPHLGRRGIAFLAAFCALTAAAWSLCGQSFADFPAYVARSIELSSGYSEAMSRPGPPWTLPIALLLLVLALAVAWRSRPVAALAATATLWIVFKAGFVRAQDHTPTFFQFAIVAPLLLGAGGRLATAARLACAALAIVGLRAAGGGEPPAWKEQHADPFHRVAAHAAALVHPEEFRARVAALAADDEGWMDLPRTREIVGAGTVDMMSFLQVLVFGNGLAWKPRPVFQGYACFTADLADRNARFLESGSAPEFVLFHLQTIDSRFPTMDDAAALEVLARDYLPVLRERDLLLLRKSPRSGQREPAELVSWKEAAFGERVDLGELRGACHLLGLDVRATLLGRLWTTLAWAPALKMELELDDGTRFESRIVPGMMRAGVIVDPVIRTHKDWLAWETAQPLRRPVALRVLPPELPWMYERSFGVRIERADSIAPPPRPDLERTLTYSLFPTPPADVVSARPPGRGLLSGEEALLLSASAQLAFDVAPGAHRLTGRFGLSDTQPPGKAADGALFRAVLSRPGQDDVVLFERRLDPIERAEDRRLQSVDLRFEATGPSRLVLRSEAGPKAREGRDKSCWSAIRIE